MNFFEAQAKAKRHTFIILLLFIVAIGGLVVLTNLTLVIALTALETDTIETAIYTFMDNATPKMWFISTGLVLVIVGSGSLYMIFELSKGGAFVASALGGKKVHPHTNDLKEKQLLNVVTEMAIASGIAVPPVYILKDKSINAFAAGHNSDDVVIGVTQGLLDFLERDELQGVIAHEFSHIFNGDMKINMRLAGALHGIVLVGLIGELILRGTLENRSQRSRGFQTSSSSNSKEKNNGGNLVLIILAVAVTFYIIGLLGKLVGGLLKAMISKKREYLADATAVQYTRYPKGIAGALKKIGALDGGSTIDSGDASTYSHLYFANGVSSFFDTLFATHPPLKKRILAIDPHWNGKYPKIKPATITQEFKATPKETKQEKKERMATVITAATVGAKIDSAGRIKDKHLKYAQQVQAQLNENIKDKAADTLGAQTLILALLYDSDPKLQKRQESMIPKQMMLEFEQSKQLIKTVDRSLYLELVHLCMPSLKSSSKRQYQAFKSYMTHFMEVDKKLTLFEWCLQHIVIRPLDKAFGEATEVKMIHATIGGVKKEAEILFSMLIQVQYKDEDKAKSAFDRVKKLMTLPVFEYRAKSEITLLSFTQAMTALQTAKLPIKRRILESALAMMHADDKLSTIEYEMIHAIAEVLQVPLPPLSVNY